MGVNLCCGWNLQDGGLFKIPAICPCPGNKLNMTLPIGIICLVGVPVLLRMEVSRRTSSKMAAGVSAIFEEHVVTAVA